MSKRIVVAVALLVMGCNIFDKTPTEPTCTPIDFGVPDSVAIVEAKFCR